MWLKFHGTDAFKLLACAIVAASDGSVASWDPPAELPPAGVSLSAIATSMSTCTDPTEAIGVEQGRLFRGWPQKKPRLRCLGDSRARCHTGFFHGPVRFCCSPHTIAPKLDWTKWVLIFFHFGKKWNGDVWRTEPDQKGVVGKWKCSRSRMLKIWGMVIREMELKSDFSRFFLWPLSIWNRKNK